MDDLKIGDKVLMFQLDKPVIAEVVRLLDGDRWSTWHTIRVRVITPGLGFRVVNPGLGFEEYECRPEALKKLLPEDLAMLDLKG